MSAPLASLFHGDINIEVGCDTAMYGYGDISVYRQATVGTGNSTESTDASTGALVVIGGLGVSKQTNLAGMLTAFSNSNLRTTFIDTSFGPGPGLSITGGNGVLTSVGNTISMNTVAGDILCNSTPYLGNNGRIVLTAAGAHTLGAIALHATNVDGGLNMKSGQYNGLDISTGSLGIVGTTVQGPISLTANNGIGEFIINSASDNKNLTLKVNGNTNSGILIQSDGVDDGTPAIKINTTFNSGNIYITNNDNGNNDGKISIFAGSNGLTATTNTLGSITLTARDAPSSFIVESAGDAKDLTVGVIGATDSSLVLKSEGTGIDALQINTTNATGSIKVLQATGSGGINVTTGSTGFGLETQTGGGINIKANGSASSIINQTTADTQDLTICVRGNTDSSLVLCSQGTGTDAVRVSSSGGIYAFSAGVVSINSTDPTNGIKIGTNHGEPVQIGKTGSLTTINGNLDVRGVTTTYESTVVQIADNILELNTVPVGSANAGVAIKRYQPANNSGLGTVITDTEEASGVVISADATSITLGPSASSVTDAYAGYWIYINSGTGNGAVRRIKSYNGSTKVADIYTTADQTSVLGNPSPQEGLNFGVNDYSSVSGSIPDSTSTYKLYPCEWIVSMWDETLNEWALVCSNHISGGSNATPVNPLHYINLHINNLTANLLTINSINGLTADVQFSIPLQNDLTTGVALDPTEVTTYPHLTSYPDYGVFIILARPKEVSDSANRCYGVFVVGRRNDNSCGQVARLISVKGSLGDMLDMEWPYNPAAPGHSYPKLKYRPAPGNNSNTTMFTIKMIAV